MRLIKQEDLIFGTTLESSVLAGAPKLSCVKCACVCPVQITKCGFKVFQYGVLLFTRLH